MNTPETAAPVDRPARRWLKFLLLAAIIVAPLGGVGGYQVHHYVKTDPNFCKSCHLMQDAFDAWSQGVHKEVACQKCHEAKFFEEVQLAWDALIKNPEIVEPHKVVPSSVCNTCHANEPSDPKWAQVKETAGHKEHVLERGIECLACHVQKLHAFKAELGICTKCHDAEKLKLTGMNDLHCVGCHDFLGKEVALVPAANQCRRCHANEPRTEEVVSKPVQDGSRTAERMGLQLKTGQNALAWKGHEDCLGCHKPHGEKLDDPVDCLRCHKQLLEAESTHVKEGQLGGCIDCHNPHTTKDWE